MTYPRLRAILCADWSKDPKKREVYLADIDKREVRRLEGHWTAAAVIQAAREAAGDGAALATFDAPIGVPTSYWQKLQESPDFPEGAKNFAEWLPTAAKHPRFFDNAKTPWDWKVERPFFGIAAGAGGRRVWEAKLDRAGVTPLRRIDDLTGAKPVFITAGIPGVAGAAARALWNDLYSLLPSRAAHPEEARPPDSSSSREPDRTASDRRIPAPPTGSEFALWPFEGDLRNLLKKETVVVAEIYPRAAYALALSRDKATERAPLKIAKTNREIREAALEDLKSRPWLEKHGVTLKNTTAAANSEDAFDALFAAAGLLRCVLKETPLAADDLTDPVAEGGILGTGSLDLTLKERTYTQQPEARQPRTRTRPRRRKAVAPDMRPRIAGAPRPPQPPDGPDYPCPIAGCDHVFTGSRAGWDAHVSSVRIHPKWQPDVRDPAKRKALFRDRFARFFV